MGADAVELGGCRDGRHGYRGEALMSIAALGVLRRTRLSGALRASGQRPAHCEHNVFVGIRPSSLNSCRLFDAFDVDPLITAPPKSLSGQ